MKTSEAAPHAHAPQQRSVSTSAPQTAFPALSSEHNFLPSQTSTSAAVVSSDTAALVPASPLYPLVQRVRTHPQTLTPVGVRQLHRALGNQAVGRLLAASRMPPTSTLPAPTLQAQPLPEPMPFAAVSSSGNAVGLPDRLKAGVESLSGISLDDVSVHYNSARPAQVQAEAYTQGSDIHVAPGQEPHLPHEAWHVVQQKTGRVRPTMQTKSGIAVNDDAGLEREADVMARKATQLPDAEASRPDLLSNTLLQSCASANTTPLQRMYNGKHEEEEEELKEISIDLSSSSHAPRTAASDPQPTTTTAVNLQSEASQEIVEQPSTTSAEQSANNGPPSSITGPAASHPKREWNWIDLLLEFITIHSPGPTTGLLNALNFISIASASSQYGNGYSAVYPYAQIGVGANIASGVGDVTAMGITGLNIKNKGNIRDDSNLSDTVRRSAGEAWKQGVADFLTQLLDLGAQMTNAIAVFKDSKATSTTILKVFSPLPSALVSASVAGRAAWRSWTAHSRARALSKLITDRAELEENGRLMSVENSPQKTDFGMAPQHFKQVDPSPLIIQAGYAEGQMQKLRQRQGVGAAGALASFFAAVLATILAVWPFISAVPDAAANWINPIALLLSTFSLLVALLLGIIKSGKGINKGINRRRGKKREANARAILNGLREPRNEEVARNILAALGFSSGEIMDLKDVADFESKKNLIMERLRSW